MKKLTRKDFAEMFGVEQSFLAPETIKLIDSLNFRYRTITGDELETLVLSILKRIDSDQQIVGAIDRKQRWQDGWQENLESFKESGFLWDALIPKFIRPGQPLRLRQEYIYPEDPHFEMNFIRVLRSWIANTYFLSSESIYEFGCGTGFNLLDLSNMFPEKKFYGSDFVYSSTDLVNSIGKETGRSISAEYFDMKDPNYSYRINPSSAIFTFGAMEQLAGEINPMLSYLLSQEANICIHIEPAEELYDKNNLSDFLAFKFQSKRKYTSGLISRLEELANQGLVEIVRIKRLFFGSLYMEGYNILAWKKISS
ncbi:hypothetical protein [Rheinheimera sp.]|uniref:hypothetical protein n=1 Tax=Rheinheimera sp. TaxID=1869214 RepID=UPI004048374A